MVSLFYSFVNSVEQGGEQQEGEEQPCAPPPGGNACMGLDAAACITERMREGGIEACGTDAQSAGTGDDVQAECAFADAFCGIGQMK